MSRHERHGLRRGTFVRQRADERAGNLQIDAVRTLPARTSSHELGWEQRGYAASKTCEFAHIRGDDAAVDGCDHSAANGYDSSAAGVDQCGNLSGAGRHIQLISTISAPAGRAVSRSKA